jgi:HEPN domain-containing protein
MKALISSHNRKYPFTHNLLELLAILAECGEVLPAFPFPWKRLEPFSVTLRYDFSEDLTEADRKAMSETVALLREYVVTRILELERQP